MDETGYSDNLLRKIIERIQRRNLSPELLSEIKDDTAWDKAKIRLMNEGRAEGEREKAWVIAKNMRLAAIDFETIQQVTGLSLEQIRAL